MTGKPKVVVLVTAAAGAVLVAQQLQLSFIQMNANILWNFTQYQWISWTHIHKFNHLNHNDDQPKKPTVMLV